MDPVNLLLTLAVVRWRADSINVGYRGQTCAVSIDACPNISCRCRIGSFAQTFSTDEDML